MNGHVASADFHQLINSEIVLVIRTSGDRLIIVRDGGHCGECLSILYLSNKFQR